MYQNIQQPMLTALSHSEKKKSGHIKMCPICMPAKIRHRFIMKMTI